MSASAASAAGAAGVAGVAYSPLAVDSGDKGKGRAGVKRNTKLAEKSSAEAVASAVLHVLTFPLSVCCSCVQVVPNEEKIISYWGSPIEILRVPGMYYRNPCGIDLKTVVTTQQSSEITKLDVNDLKGNPIQISAQYVWRISNAYKATFNVANHARFIHEQAVTALRDAAAHHPYDVDDVSTTCLRRPSDEISTHLLQHLQSAVNDIGIEILLFRITSVGYSHSMEKLLLARQEAEAQVTAKKTLTDGLTAIVNGMIENLERSSPIPPEQKAAIKANLLYLMIQHGQTHLYIVNGSGANPLSPIMQPPMQPPLQLAAEAHK